MEREKALDMALGQIEKQFGKGAIMRMGEDAKVKISSIPTGALSLDLALGIGGLPRGRVIEIYGPESSGKCLTADTYVWTDRGLETVGELFARCGQPTSCTSRITDVSDLDVRAVNERGELEPVVALTHNDRRPVLRLRLQSGRTITVTHNHPLRLVSQRGFLTWRKAAEIAVGDTLVSAAFGAVEAAGGDGLSEDEAVFLGYLVAAGSLSRRDTVRFTHGDVEVGGEFTRLAEGLFGSSVRCHDGEECAIDDPGLRRRLAEDYGLEDVAAAGRRVPAVVRTAGHKAQRAFLSALFEGAGWGAGVPDAGPVGLTTASEPLAREVQLLLYGLGLPATITSTWDERSQRDDWSVAIDAAVAHRFLDEVGFRSARRARQVQDHVRGPGEARFQDVPNLDGLLRDLRDDLGGDAGFDRVAGDLFRADTDRGCSRRRLEAIVAWVDARGEDLAPSAAALVEHLRTLAQSAYTYERVVAVEDAGHEPTFDLALPRTHSFVANAVLSHNTTVALHAVAEAQKAGGIAAFIDAEHALDPAYAAALGVDVEALLVSQPDTGEQALEITDMLVRSGAVDIVVVDSVAALTPRAEIEGEMGDSHVGLQARLMSQALRKLAGTLSKSKTSAVFINQLREKIGVMFGCFDWHTRVTLADGTQEEIGRIVDERLAVDVLTYDAASGEIVARPVTNWFNNGPTSEFLTVTVARGSGSAPARFSATPNHLVSTPGGWREAGDLAVGDRVLQAVTHRLSSLQREVVLGSLMGDGTLSPPRSGQAVRFRFGGSAAPAAYADWKASLFGNLGTSRTANGRGGAFHDVEPLPELAELRDAVHLGGTKVLSHDYLKQLTPLSLAVWYMDEAGSEAGSGRAEICVEAMEASSRARLRDHLADTWGIAGHLVERGGSAVLVLPPGEAAKLQELIAPYVHPSMDDKLLPRFRGQFSVAPAFDAPRQVLVPLPVLDVERTPMPDDPTTRCRYDIEVAGTHNYFVDGVMVHNSPETTPGGRALKFYSSVRLDVRRIESLKDGTDVVGNRVRVKVVKNKCLAAGTRVFDPTTGLTHAIEDVVEHGAGTAVWAADKTGALHVRPIRTRMIQGEQDVIGLRLRDGTTLRVTPDHKVLTDGGWREAGQLVAGDRVARPRRVGRFGDARPVPPEQARMVGHLVGDGDAGKTNALAAEQRLPAAFFAPDVAEDVLANLLCGLWESGGWVTREQTDVRCGFVTTSDQLAQQVHWLLLRWGIPSSVVLQEPGARRGLGDDGRAESDSPCWQVRVRGIDDVQRLAEALPLWGPRGQALVAALDDPALERGRGSQANDLPAAVTDAILQHLHALGVTGSAAASMLGRGDGRGGLRQVLGRSRLRRDRVQQLADALDSQFLRDVLAEDLYYERICEITAPQRSATYDVEVEELHNLVADDVVVHNCAPPFRQAEFDIMYGEGISREGSILDVGVENGIIKKAGAWYTYEGEQLGQGRENARNFLKEHDEVAAEIYKKVTEQLGLVPTDITGDEAGED